MQGLLARFFDISQKMRIFFAKIALISDIFYCSRAGKVLQWATLGETDKTSERKMEGMSRNATAPRISWSRGLGGYCPDCRLSKLLLSARTKERAGRDDMHQFRQIDKVVQHRQHYDKGECLYRQGDKFSSFHVVNSGSFKSYRLTRNDHCRVIGFYLPGELVGIDGMANECHSNSCEALEPASVCGMVFAEEERLGHLSLGLLRNLLTVMAEQIALDQDIQVLMGGYSSDARVAAFLLSLSSRYSTTGKPVNSFRLPMCRTEIGEYLGMNISTVSRVFKRLQGKGLVIVKNGRKVTLPDADALYNFAISV